MHKCIDIYKWASVYIYIYILIIIKSCLYYESYGHIFLFLSINSSLSFIASERSSRLHSWSSQN